MTTQAIDVHPIVAAAIEQAAKKLAATRKRAA